MEAYRFQSARELFEAAREASRDAERIRRQLLSMEARAEGLGGGGFEPRVRSSREPDRMGSAVASYVDMEAKLRERQREDYDTIDLACAVLYGTDSDAGLWALVGWRADAIWHHYLDGRTWEEVGALMGYSPQHVRREVSWALDLADANGMMWTERGEGMAT